MTYAVICHPHPLHGGTMHNKVVYTIAKTFNELGVGTVRFNFRGVGKSSGQFDQGIGETEDLLAISQWLQTEYAPRELWLAGFSFGGYVALRGLRQLVAHRLLLVAPAVERFAFSEIQVSNIPTLVIQGRQDDVVSPQTVANWVANQEYPPQLQWLEEADHFFHGQLQELSATISQAWQEWL
jgi:alpha/beta superfamily hydrolase